MNGQIRFLICCAAPFLVVDSVSAYERATHALVTLRAYKKSFLTTSTAAREDLGLSRYLDVPSIGKNPFGSFYLDFGSEVRQRKARPFEIRFMPDDPDPELGFSRLEDPLKAEGWILRGAIREDDVPWIPFLSNDDPID